MPKFTNTTLLGDFARGLDSMASEKVNMFPRDGCVYATSLMLGQNK
jgi:hypothetical protein